MQRAHLGIHSLSVAPKPAPTSLPIFLGVKHFLLGVGYALSSLRTQVRVHRLDPIAQRDQTIPLCNSVWARE